MSRVSKHELRRRLSPLGKMFHSLGMIRLYQNGDTVSFIWRFWHPLVWIFVPLMFIASGFVTGFPNTWKYREDLGLAIDPYFKKNNIDPFNQ